MKRSDQPNNEWLFGSALRPGKGPRKCRTILKTVSRLTGPTG